MVETCGLSNIFKGAVPLVAKQLLSAETSDEDIGETIGIVIADRSAKRVADTGIAGRVTGDFAKAELSIFKWSLLSEESVGNHDDFLLRGEHPTSGDEQIPASISIVIDGTDATSVGFNHRDEPCALAVAVREIDADIGAMRCEL